MEYIKVEWLYDFKDEPSTFYSELDENRLEIRKVEVYKDGRMAYASKDVEVNTCLSDYVIPNVEEISDGSEFRAEIILEQEFQTIWER